MIGLNVLIALVTSRNRRIADFIGGTAVLIGRDGKVFLEKLKQSRISEADVEQALREADCELTETKCIFLESDGTISVMKVKD